MSVQHEIYMGTILLEVNRHKPGRVPTVLVSDWIDRITQVGFDGLELWENHAVLASEDEIGRIRASGMPVSVYNTYARFTQDTATERASATECTRRLGAAGVKFNFDRDTSLRDDNLRQVAAWRDTLPPGIRALCECHPGTLAETPEQAAALFDQLGHDRYEMIVHPVARPSELPGWFQTFGPRVTHAHMQLRDQDNLPILLERRPALVRDTLHLMREEGFTGSFTLEFTEGTNRPGENTELLWANALRDLQFLREALV